MGWLLTTETTERRHMVLDNTTGLNRHNINDNKAVF